MSDRGLEIALDHRLSSFPRVRESILIPAAQARWIDSPLPRLALRAIRFANVRSGILPSQSACAGMTSFLFSALLLILMASLSGCSPPPVPDVTYFRLPAPAPLPHANKPLTLLPIEIDTFNAEGVYSEQALIYTVGDGSAVRTYHYQLWSDPPTHALQTRLIAALRGAGISELVTDRLPASTQALRVRGTIRRYERVVEGKNFKAAVTVELRVEQDEGEPLLLQEYHSEKDAADATLNATVGAFGAAVDEVFAAFYADLVKLRSDVHAR